MNKIALLPPVLANQIAAGEVIERPASVVKELVENSLDAGAKNIEIVLQKAGRELIRISDNGSGMSSMDAILSLERHATSKIKNFEDLLSVQTMGFRGEALPSIASISHFTLLTREKNSKESFEVKIEGGKIVSKGIASRAEVGTTISVEHLFYNVPARRKFLKTDVTELEKCIELVKSLALANPRVGFSLTCDKRSVINVPANQSVLERLNSIFGKDFTSKLLPLQSPTGVAKISGFISPVGEFYPNRSRIFFFLNRRPVEGKLFNLALRDAYGVSIGVGRQPSVFAFLELPAESFDINVHPAKREVRFRDERALLQLLTRSFGDTLNTPHKIFSPQDITITTSEDAFSLKKTPNQLPVFGGALGAFSPSLSYAPFGATNNAPKDTQPNSPQKPSPELFRSQTQFSVPTLAENAPSHGWQFLSFLRSDFALFSTPEGLAIVSLKNARACAVFDKIEQSLRAKKPASQALLVPALLQVEGTLAATLKKHLGLFTQQGFVVTPFGTTTKNTGTWRLEAIPAWLTPENGFTGTPESLFMSELHMLVDEENFPREASAQIKYIASRAANLASNRPTHPQAAITLINELLSCKNPLKTPLGEPTVWLITSKDLKKRFGL
jgi:DNA mismatch repair protein MutL